MVKSGLMVGLGEKHREVIDVMRDLRISGCEVLTLGQSMQPSLRCIRPSDWISDEEFARYREEALQLGFRSVMAGSYVRSSYLAEVQLEGILS